MDQNCNLCKQPDKKSFGGKSNPELYLFRGAGAAFTVSWGTHRAGKTTVLKTVAGVVKTICRNRQCAGTGQCAG